MISYSPSNIDIASSVFYGLSSWSFGRGSFVNGTIKQYITTLIADNIANNASIIKKNNGVNLITDQDFWTGILRVGCTIYELGTTDIYGKNDRVVSSETKVKKVTKEIVEGVEGEEIKRTIEDEFQADPKEVREYSKETEPLMINGYPNKKITLDLVSSVVSVILARIIFEERKINFI